MDYRACKKAIKVIAIRLGEAEAAGDASGTHATDMVAHGELDDGSSDEDFGPVASPKEMNPNSGRNSLRNVSAKSPAASARSRDRALSPPGTGGGGIKKAVASSPGYGATSTTTSPRIVNGRSTAPPPLDLGDPSYEADAPLTKRSGLGQGTIIPSPTHSDESKERNSDDMAETSDSTRPLTSRALSRIVKASPKVGKSPRFANTPSPKGMTSPRPTQLPSSSKRSVRKFVMKLVISPSADSVTGAMTMPSPRTMRTARSFEELYESLEPDEKAFFDLLQRELDKVDSFYNAREADAQRRAHDLRDQLHELAQHRKIFHEMYPNGLPEWEAKVGRIIPVPGGATTIGGVAKSLRQRIPWMDSNSGVVTSGPSADSELPDEQRKQRLREEMSRDAEHHTYNPERYSKYKKELKDASMEFYRQLELIKNYRVSRHTGEARCERGLMLDHELDGVP